MVFDNRSNQESDFHQAVAVTATGVVKEVEVRKRNVFKNCILPSILFEEFVSSPTCALLKVEVETYFVVNRFQMSWSFT